MLQREEKIPLCSLQHTCAFCISQEVNKGDSFVGNYQYKTPTSTNEPPLTTTIMNHPQKLTLMERKDPKSTFSFVATIDGSFEICFYNEGTRQRTVTLDVKERYIKKMREGRTTAKHMEPLQMQVKNLVETAKYMVDDLEQLKGLEWSQRDINGTIIVCTHVINDNNEKFLHSLFATYSYLF